MKDYVNIYNYLFIYLNFAVFRREFHSYDFDFHFKNKIVIDPKTVIERLFLELYGGFRTNFIQEID